MFLFKTEILQNNWYTTHRVSQVMLVAKNLPANAGDVRDVSLISGSGRFPWRRAWQLTPIFLPGEIPGTEEPGVDSIQFSRSVRLFETPRTAAHQAFLSITNSWSLLKLMSMESVMPSNHLFLCHPLLLPPSIFPTIMVFSNGSVLRIRWPKY